MRRRSLSSRPRPARPRRAPALRWASEQGQHLEQDGLARAVRPDDDQHLAFEHVQVRDVHAVRSAAPHPDVAEGELGLTHDRRSCCCTVVRIRLTTKIRAKQDDRQRDGRGEVAPLHLQHHRRRQHPRLPRQVAADHHRRPDLRDGAPETGHHRRQQRQLRLPEHEPQHLEPRGAQSVELAPQPWVEVAQRRRREAGDDGRADDGLGDHHRRRRVDQAELAERPASPEHDRHHQPDDDRRQAHAGVHQAEGQVAARKLLER